MAHGDFLIGTGIINADLMRFVKANNSERSRLLLIIKKQINFSRVLAYSWAQIMSRKNCPKLGQSSMH